jgi:hypothetical protein
MPPKELSLLEARQRREKREFMGHVADAQDTSLLTGGYFSGWLKRETEFGFTKQFFARICDGCLQIMANESDLAVKETIDLARDVVDIRPQVNREAMQVDIQRVKTDSGMLFEVVLGAGKKPWVLTTDSEEQSKEWMEELQRERQDAHAGLGQQWQKLGRKDHSEFPTDGSPNATPGFRRRNKKTQGRGRADDDYRGGGGGGGGCRMPQIGSGSGSGGSASMPHLCSPVPYDPANCQLQYSSRSSARSGYGSASESESGSDRGSITVSGADRSGCSARGGGGRRGGKEPSLRLPGISKPSPDVLKARKAALLSAKTPIGRSGNLPSATHSSTRGASSLAPSLRPRSARTDAQPRPAPRLPLTPAPRPPRPPSWKNPELTPERAKRVKESVLAEERAAERAAVQAEEGMGGGGAHCSRVEAEGAAEREGGGGACGERERGGERFAAPAFAVPGLATGLATGLVTGLAAAAAADAHEAEGEAAGGGGRGGGGVGARARQRARAACAAPSAHAAAKAARARARERGGAIEFPELIDDVVTFAGAAAQGSLRPVEFGGERDLQRGGHTAVLCAYAYSAPDSAHRYHPVESRGGRLVVFGGKRLPNECLNDLHVLEVDCWRWFHPAVQGEAPAARCWHTANLVPAAGGEGGGAASMVLFGGCGADGEALGDVHVLALGDHRQQPPPPRPASASPAPPPPPVLPLRWSRLVVDGPPRALAPAALAPAARYQHAAVVWGGQLWVLGGRDACLQHVDNVDSGGGAGTGLRGPDPSDCDGAGRMWRLDLTARRWLPPPLCNSSAGAPPPLTGHTMTATRALGGAGGGGGGGGGGVVFVVAGGEMPRAAEVHHQRQQDERREKLRQVHGQRRRRRRARRRQRQLASGFDQQDEPEPDSLKDSGAKGKGKGIGHAPRHRHVHEADEGSDTDSDDAHAVAIPAAGVGAVGQCAVYLFDPQEMVWSR